MADHKQTHSEAQEDAAAAWMARRDRGLDPSEAKDYAEWLAADPSHADAIQHLEKVWQYCDRLEQWRPANSRVPNPDLLAPPRPRPRPRGVLWGSLAAGLAAAVTLALFAPWSPDTSRLEASAHPLVLSGGDGHKELSDGSLIEMRRDAIVEVVFDASARRVHLVRGEAFFTVAHDATRPFVVEAAGVTVQALGTVFSVGLDQFDVSVEVTEGSVEVRKAPSPTTTDAREGLVLAAGERAVLRYARLIPYDEVRKRVDPAGPTN
jgi:transmembrane sensor